MEEGSLNGVSGYSNSDGSASARNDKKKFSKDRTSSRRDIVRIIHSYDGAAALVETSNIAVSSDLSDNANEKI